MVIAIRPARRALLVASLSVCLLAAPQANAFESVAEGTRHFFQCFGLMLSKPATHEQQCLPNRVPSPNGSIASSGGGAVVVPPPVEVPAPPVVVVVVPPPEPPPAPDPCVCGCPT